jgi:hypothetical protein
MTLVRQNGVVPWPMLDGLQTHAIKYGIEGVRQTASDLDISWSIRSTESARARSKLRDRRTTDELRREVFALHDRGMNPRPIADALNLSDRRIADILQRCASLS